ncbi:hypothetical protein P171DRAFT_232542 [Karstenula rhodostoma CBS 690.94]|uniref:Uncharacterized protein n=1 Tax=Karstenula rhodostoma CBS 690.94 TaxID=1392251 RepID=A0A9P4PMF9_9PLEO|nr:hypothetical protein P171DRAFT_232542 [Karstenula rhodostoma CBS 690.94]
MLDARRSHLEKRNNHRVFGFGVFGALYLVHPLAFCSSFGLVALQPRFQLSLTFPSSTGTASRLHFQRGSFLQEGNYRGHVLSVRARTGPRRMITQSPFLFHPRGERFVRDTSLDRAFVSWIISFLDWRIPPKFGILHLRISSPYHSTLYYSTWIGRIGRFERFTSWIIGDKGKKARSRNNCS